jgi:hypothetical protein
VIWNHPSRPLALNALEAPQVAIKPASTGKMKPTLLETVTENANVAPEPELGTATPPGTVTLHVYTSGLEPQFARVSNRTSRSPSPPEKGST